MASIYERYGDGEQPETPQQGSIYDRYGAVAPTETPDAKAAEERGGILRTVLDVVGTPGRMTAGAVRAMQEGDPLLQRVWENLPASMGGTQQDDFDDVLAATGYEDPFQKRKAISFEQGVALGIFEPDVRKIMEVRLTRGARAVVDARFISDTYKQFGRKIGARRRPCRVTRCPACQLIRVSKAD